MSEDKEKIVPANDPCADCPPDYIPDDDLVPSSLEIRKKCGRSYDPNAVDPNGNFNVKGSPEPVAELEDKKKFFGGK
jgi:hypothetical protein